MPGTPPFCKPPGPETSSRAGADGPSPRSLPGPRSRGSPVVAGVGIWIPAFAGMTGEGAFAGMTGMGRPREWRKRATAVPHSRLPDPRRSVPWPAVPRPAAPALTMPWRGAMLSP